MTQPTPPAVTCQQHTGQHAIADDCVTPYAVGTPPGDHCKCLAWDPIYNDHTAAEHTECRPGGDPPCGGCDSCLSGMAAYAQRLEGQP